MDQLSLRQLGLGGPAADEAADGKSPRARLVHQSAKTAVYRLQDRGIKVVLAADPGLPSEEETRALLLHEQRVSNFLPPSCLKRQVIDVTSFNFNERPALTFRWVNGLTLAEWLRTLQGDPEDCLDVRLRAAMAVAKTVTDFHDGGVVHNSLSPDNIVMSFDGGEFDCKATLIDLSNAIIYRNGNTTSVSETQMRAVDLKSLGLVLGQLFWVGIAAGIDGGFEPDAGGNADRDRSNKRGKQRIVGEGLPPYLGAMISALLLDSASLSEQRYESAKDVLFDLKKMDQNNKLVDGSASGRLHLQGEMFYGRRVEMAMLMHLFESTVAMGTHPLMALISGSPGSGKSTLVRQIKQPLMEKNGSFIEGKFVNSSSRPDSVLMSALNSFFGNIINTYPGNHRDAMPMKKRIQDAIGSNSLLIQLLPNLQTFMGTAPEHDPSACSSFVKGRGLRLKIMLTKLIGAIACAANPMILLLDDLQWADEMTLDIITMVMTDPKINHLLFLGCHREVCRQHPLMNWISSIHEQGVGTSVVTIKVGPIEQDCVNSLISDTFNLPESLCRPLAQVVHNKTGGIILFILRLLASLNDDGLLWFDMSLRRWMYDLNKIREEEIHEDVVAHMTHHMTRLPKKMQFGMRLAACLGSSFDSKVLFLAQKEGELDDSFLEDCVQFGFLRKTGSSQYAFSHDQIWQAAYSLIPEARRESFRLLIGSRLFTKTLPDTMKQMIFIIVDNMNHGSNLIVDCDRRYELSELNFQAGETALESSAFHSGAKYFLSGISLLGPDSWQNKYDLTLKLYDAASEALYVTGDFAALFTMMTDPLQNARNFEDKLNIYHNVVRAFSASLKCQETIAMCLDILQNLGEDIPSDITADVCRNEAINVVKLIKSKSQEELLALPLMTDPQKLAAMHFLNHALSMTYIHKPSLNPPLVFRMVKLSLQYGVCAITCFAFGLYGAFLVTEGNDMEGGLKMGQVAMTLMKRLGAVEMTGRVHAMVYAFINIWKEPWKASLSKHLESYESGLATGEMEYGLAGLYHYTKAALFGGEKLEPLSQDIAIFAQRAFQFGQFHTWKCLLIYHQMALDLMGRQENAWQPYPGDMTEESCFESTLSSNESSICRLLCNKRKYVFYLTGSLDKAREQYELAQQFPFFGIQGRMLNTCVSTFVDGLVGFFFARKRDEDEDKWLQVGREALSTMEKWAGHSAWNFANKWHLLQAEFYFYTEDDEQATACYHASIKAAREHRLVHEQGLAEEKAATFCLHKNMHEEAMLHFRNAKECYEVWGANPLVKRTDQAIEMLQPLVDAEASH